MTVIAAVVGKTHIAIASDSLVCWGGLKATTTEVESTKLIPVGRSWIGTSGEDIYAFIMEDYLSGLKRKPTLTNEHAIFTFFNRLRGALKDRYHYTPKGDGGGFAEFEARFMIANPSGLYTVDQDLAITRHKRFCAIGSGGWFALGALEVLSGDPKETAIKAVEAAIKLDVYCGGDIEHAEVKLRR